MLCLLRVTIPAWTVALTHEVIPTPCVELLVALFHFFTLLQEG